MDIKDQLEEDVEIFFQNIDRQLPENKKKMLKMIIDKYAHLYSSPILLDKYDFDMIKSHAHAFFINSAFPKFVGPTRRKIDQYEANVLSIVEGTIVLFNRKECFKKLPKFDYKE